MGAKRERKICTLAAKVGGNIAKMRQSLGFSQEQFAEKLGIGGDSLSRIEKGITSPRYSRLEKIAKELDCHISELFADNGAPLPTKLKSIGELISPLPVEIQDNLIDLMTNMITTFRRSLLKTNSMEGKAKSPVTD